MRAKNVDEIDTCLIKIFFRFLDVQGEASQGCVRQGPHPQWALWRHPSQQVQDEGKP